MEIQKVSSDLEAVGMDFGGDIKPIDKLSYMPSDGWKRTDPKFILVVHEWWIDSLGFKVTPLDCKTKEDAFVEGLMVQHKILSDRRFRKADFTIIELESGLVVARSIRRRLTLWERLTGYVNQ